VLCLVAGVLVITQSHPPKKIAPGCRGVWPCGRCTFENTFNDGVCQMCFLGRRPFAVHPAPLAFAPGANQVRRGGFGL